MSPRPRDQLFVHGGVCDPRPYLESRYAEGHSNSGICEKLVLSSKTVEGHVNNIFRKLDIGNAPSYQRRVVAVLTFLRAAAQ